ncbi:MAG: ribosomal protein, partial [Planctomycetota bacterium]
MAKKFASTERFLKPDPKFGSRTIAKFVNSVMKQGKKTTARRVVYAALEEVAKKLPEQKADEVFAQAINNLKPVVEVRSKRVGGANYQVPIEVKRNRQQSLAFRWILDVCRDRPGRPMAVRLADEIVAAYKNEGAAISI